INAVENMIGLHVPKVIGQRRPGDPAALVCDPRKAIEILGWSPKYGLKAIVDTAWTWHQRGKRTARRE
ncbi:MAG: UDP-glucose 4-epimerase GalE, partial [Hyphomicrobiaceae bacterium]